MRHFAAKPCEEMASSLFPSEIRVDMETKAKVTLPSIGSVTFGVIFSVPEMF